MVKSFLSMLLVLGLCSTVMAQDQGMTSETHKKNVGKILWAKQRIKMDMQDRMTYENNFDHTDSIYGRIYLSKSLIRLSKAQGGNCENTKSEFEIRYFVDNKDSGVINKNVFKSSDWTTGQISLKLTSGDSEDDINTGVPSRWAKAVNSMSAGKHDVRFEFWGGAKECLAKYAEGAFTLVKKGSGKLETASVIPAPRKKDAKLEAAMHKAFQARGWKDEKAVKIIIVEPDWRIIRDPLGNIIRREINTNIILKKNDGTCRLTDISFIEPHKGGGKYGITEVYGVGLKNIPLDCGEVK